MGRSVAFLLALVLGVSSFVLLASTARTGQLRVTGAVEEAFRPAYDILVRPKGSYTDLEKRKGLIQQNYLSGIFGGISMDQYQAIRKMQNVEVAAPIANIGYLPPFEFIPLRINRYLTQDPFQLYRLRLTWRANGGVSTYPDSDKYIYYTTRDRIVQARGGITTEILPDGTQKEVCRGFYVSAPQHLGVNPFTLGPGSGLNCFSALSPEQSYSGVDLGDFARGTVGTTSAIFFPMLLTAIDPREELKLVGLDDAIVTGRYLDSSDRPRGTSKFRTVPVIASTRTYIDEELHVDVERLDVGKEAPHRLADVKDAYSYVTERKGVQAGSFDVPIDAFYDRLLEEMQKKPAEIDMGYPGYWTAGPISYDQLPDGSLAANTVRNDKDVFRNFYYGAGWAPQENRDVQYRELHSFEGDLARAMVPSLHVVGTFDPAELPGFDPRSEVPLETYYPPSVVPGDEASRAVLGDGRLLPTQNLGGYVSQPPLLITTLKALTTFHSSDLFKDSSSLEPISVIRVRVAGVEGADPVSRERIRRVAQTIVNKTGLDVDVTAGSSPTMLQVQLPPGKYGQPALTLKEGWVEKGVAVEYLQALDHKSLALSTLIILVVCLFIANGTFAAVTSRRRELGVLRCLGWSRGEIFQTVLAEVTLIGVVAGLVVSVVAPGIAHLFGLKLGGVVAWLALPLSIGVTVAAGLLPAWRASQLTPLETLRPQVRARGHVSSIHGVTSFALANLRRVPLRTVVGSLGLFIGTAAVVPLVAINQTFQGQLVSTLLGQFISIEIRAVDFASVVLIIALGAFSLADVAFLNIRDRAAELVTLRTFGWVDSDLRRLVLTESLTVAIVATAVGISLGLGITLSISGIGLGVAAASGALAAAVGLACGVPAALIAAGGTKRLAPAVVFSED